MSAIKILFIALEFPNWTYARQWSYGAQMAFEEGFQENGVEFITITSVWLPRLKEICAGKRFDQVWVEIARNKIDDEVFEWIAGLAPVRVGMIAESLEYNHEEYDLNPVFSQMHLLVENRLRHLTHVLAVDEKDVETLNKKGTIHAMWWPSAVPRQYILDKTDPEPVNMGAFIGNAYYQRANFLRDSKLHGLLVKQSSPEAGTIYPYLFTTLHILARLFVICRLPGTRYALPLYLRHLRKIRRISFTLWIQALQSHVAVINLPCLVKAYPGRVIEGMAAGRPVISWEIPDRPQNRDLFEEGSEILLYDTPEQLASHIRKVISDPRMAETVASNARQNLLRFHTTEERVRQVLDWIESGNLPSYI